MLILYAIYNLNIYAEVLNSKILNLNKDNKWVFSILFGKRAKSSAILFALILITLFTTTNISKASGVTTDIQIVSYSSYIDSVGYYHIVGEVLNTGSSTLDYVRLDATFYNQSGTVVGTDFTYTSLSNILPGRKSPFKILFGAASVVPKIHHFAVSCTSTSVTSAPIQGLKILSNSSYTDSISYIHIVGEVKNIGPIATTYLKVIATGYNSTGNVVVYDFSYANSGNQVDVNAIVPFEILISSDRAPFVNKYSLTAESSNFEVVPEFQPWALLIILPIVTIALIITKKRLNK